MRHLARTFIFVALCLISLLVTIPAGAFPPLPSSFYGTVKVDGVNAPDGTLVRALIDGKVYAESHTKTFQGDSVYSLDIPGDDTGTTSLEGGRDGDTIQFQIDGVLAGQTGNWSSGTNVRLDLSASSATAMVEPQDTPTSLPTQVAIITQGQASTPAPVQAGSTPTITNRTRVTPSPTALAQISSSIPPSPHPENGPTGSSKTIMVIGIIATGFILFALIWLLFVRKSRAKKL